MSVLLDRCYHLSILLLFFILQGCRSTLLWEKLGDAMKVLRIMLMAHVLGNSSCILWLTLGIFNSFKTLLSFILISACSVLLLSIIYDTCFNTIVYKSLKAIDARPQIGLAHSFFHMRPYRRWNPLEYFAGKVADLVQNDLVIQFLTTGRFSFSIPLVGPHLRLNMPEAPNTLDFIGLNFYSHYHMRVGLSLKDPVWQESPLEESQMGIMTDMEYPIYGKYFLRNYF
jgi:hypothetical protein